MFAKVFLVALFFAVVYCESEAAVSPFACTLTCAGGAGANCTTPLNAASAICNDGLYCSVNTNNGQQTCVALTGLGGDCTTSSTCVGDLVCYQSKCAAVTYTVAVNQACTSVSQCANDNLICSAGTCVALPNRGESCTIACQGANVCNGPTCIQAYTVANGGECDVGGACVAGSYCSYSGSTGTCKAGFSSSNRPCDYLNRTACAAEESCGCSTYLSGTSSCQAPTTPSSAQATASVNFRQCISSNNCDTGANAYGCGACKSSFCSLWNQAKSQLNIYPSCAFGSEITKYNDYCNSAVSIVASGFVIVFALFISMM